MVDDDSVLLPRGQQQRHVAMGTVRQRRQRHVRVGLAQTHAAQLLTLLAFEPCAPAAATTTVSLGK